MGQFVSHNGAVGARQVLGLIKPRFTVSGLSDSVFLWRHKFPISR